MVDRAEVMRRNRGPGRPWPKGVSGNPKGPPKRRSMTAHLAEAVTDEARKKIAMMVRERAKRGDLEAAKFLFDRIDGRVTERIEQVGTQLHEVHIVNDGGGDPEVER